VKTWRSQSTRDSGAQVEVEMHEPLLEEDECENCEICGSSISDDENFYSICAVKNTVDDHFIYAFCNICEKYFKDSGIEVHLFKKDAKEGMGLRLCEEQCSGRMNAQYIIEP
jgi:hypothetical protein